MVHELSLSELTGQIVEIKWLIWFLQFKKNDHLGRDHGSKPKVDLILLRRQHWLGKKKKKKASLNLGPLSTDPEFVC